MVTGCFKNEPKKEMMRLAGAWNIEHAERTTYALDGSVNTTENTDNLGVLMLNHNDDFIYQGTFSLSYNANWLTWNSGMTNAFNAANSWFVNVGATRFSVGSLDSSTGFLQTIAGFTIEQSKHKKLIIYQIITNSDGNIYQLEKWYLKRP